MYDQTDSRGVPISGGIPRIVVVSAIVGIVLIFAMLSIVFLNSGSGHVWPNTKGVEIPLT